MLEFIIGAVAGFVLVPALILLALYLSNLNEV